MFCLKNEASFVKSAVEYPNFGNSKENQKDAKILICRKRDFFLNE